jgi:two-component system sensor histidine kinase YesM
MKLFEKPLILQKKLMAIFLLCMIIPTIIIFCISMIRLRGSEKDAYNLEAEKRIVSAANAVDRTFEECISKSDILLTNSFFKKGLAKDYTGDIMGVMEFYNELSVFMAGFGFQSSIMSYNTCIIYPINESMPENMYINRIDTLKQQPQLWEKLQALQDGRFLWDYSHSGGTESEVYQYISLFRSISDYDKTVAIIEIRVYLNDLIYHLRNVTHIDGEVMAYISPDNVLVYANTDKIKESYDVVHSVRVIDGSTISCMIDKRNVYGRFYKYFGSYLISFAFIMLLMLYIYRIMIARATRDLNDFVDRLQNNDEVEIKNLSTDPEVRLIMERFNELICKTRTMYKDIAQMSRLKKSMELELLQTGINPHLLYNSLGVLKWRMLRLKQNDMAEMVDNMTGYYRRVLSTSNNIITIREELELTEQYIKINEVSYEWTYTIIKDIDEELLDCPIIKLIMQPIVENSILHGLVGRENAVIRITIKKSGEYVLFTIEDNGYGMTEDKLKSALDLDNYPMGKNGYGLKNTIKRLKVYYGEDCGLEMRSKINEGTSVIIKIKNLSETELRKNIY